MISNCLMFIFKPICYACSPNYRRAIDEIKGKSFNVRVDDDDDEW